jgi:hypothetical protein
MNPLSGPDLKTTIKQSLRYNSKDFYIGITYPVNILDVIINGVFLTTAAVVLD